MPRFSGLDRRAELWAIAQMGRRVGPMAARGFLLKPLLGTSVGPLLVGRRTTISNPSYIHHAGRLVIEDGAEVQGLSRLGLRFGEEVSIGPGVMIRPSSYYGGEIGEGLVVGDRSSLASGCFIGCSGFISIGDDVLLGPAVRIFSENHVFARTDVTIKSQGVDRGRTTIGDDCWLGSGTVVVANVTIGRGVVTGANTVVTSDLPDGAVAVGSPARVLRIRTEAELDEERRSAGEAAEPG